MNFTTPAALLWALLAIPIVIFYILKIRLRRVPVSTVMFWEQIFEEKQARSIWQRLRHLLSLLMQLLLLALLVLALGDPFFSWEARQQQRLVLVLDNSASMQAIDVPPSRLARAKDMALKVIDRLRSRDEMAVVTAGTQPRVICGLTRHPRTLRNAVHSAESTDGPTRVTEAVELGRRLLADHPHGKIVVISDGGFADSAAVLATTDIAWLPLGTAAENVGITRFQARRSLLDPLGYQVLIEVRNFSRTSIECRLELELAGKIVDVWPLKLEAGGTWSQPIEQTSADGGVLIARLRHDDALSLDNEARAVLPARRKQRILLVTEGNRFLQGVFAANPLVELSVVDVLPADVLARTVIVLHKRVSAQLPAGNVVVLQPTEACELWDVSDTLDSPLVAQQDRDSPLMAHVRLDNVLLPEARKLTPKAPVKVLAASETGDPLYFAVEHPRGRVLVLTVNLDRGDLPLRTAFPILFSNALAWFEGTGGELREAVPSGGLQQVALPRELLTTPDGKPTTQLRLESPRGVISHLPVLQDQVSLGPLEQCGIWKLSHDVSISTQAAPQASPMLEIACNLADPVESDLRTTAISTTDTTVLTAGLSRPLWFILTALAWALMGTECWLYQRRRIA